jgi:hypothetical protein
MLSAKVIVGVVVILFFALSIVVGTIDASNDKNYGSRGAGVFFVWFVLLFIVPMLLLSTLVTIMPVVSVHTSIAMGWRSSSSEQALGACHLAIAITLLLSAFHLNYSALFVSCLSLVVAAVYDGVWRTRRLRSGDDLNSVHLAVFVLDCLSGCVILLGGGIGMASFDGTDQDGAVRPVDLTFAN